ncbi:hypothetical protein TraAM80_02869 [Trypanosoma rangeli]|uniref:Kinetoplast DNA-associated protein n=1 Tax=Trypanosoma rangeli TaxID=5698 RepID=A0A3R7NVJ3_TRYRA|nr:uncharacterized protein TraAM80_02869 [Trypanosoma rangeli]RNF08408.1 hypothetical protein TraAM80_02869 [Trypanosoma rangeli]|eukprot:RNF08408.1 hypothetical protein TraAM80_02869 [Trypanosoma rangeli]
MLRTVGPLYNSRKLTLRFFQTEQRRNTNLHGLSAVQKKKVIVKMFNQLTRDDMEALKRRAAAWEAKNMGDYKMTPSYRYPNEITPYELFYKEQLSNPAIASIASPSIREKRLFAIFNTLPEATRETLERRAREFSRREVVSISPTPPRKKHSVSKKEKKLTIKTGGGTRKTTKTKTSARKNKTGTKATVSSYATFVKEQMPHVKHLPIKERMKVIAAKWNSIKTATAVDKPGLTTPAAATPSLPF